MIPSPRPVSQKKKGIPAPVLHIPGAGNDEVCVCVCVFVCVRAREKYICIERERDCVCVCVCVCVYVLFVSQRGNDGVRERD